MARPRAFDENDVLDRAMDVFCRHGYEGSSMAELTVAMGLSAPSIYAAFGSKRGLFDAVIDHYNNCEREHRDWVLGAPTAREVVERMLFRAAEQLPSMEGAPGCLLIQGGITAGPGNQDIPVELARQRQANVLALRDRFDRARVDGDLPADVDTAALAGLVTAVFDGLAVKAAGGATARELRKVAEQAVIGWQTRAGIQKSTQISYVSSVDDEPGRGRPREFSATDALDAAMEVFWRKGYEGASISDLTEAMGIKRPSLYDTFGNKEGLFLKALDRYQAVNGAYVLKALDAPTAREVVEQMLDGAVAAQLSDRQPRGCFVLVNSMQGGDEAKVVRAEILRRIEEGHGMLVARFECAKAEGDLPSSADTEGLARLLVSVLNGVASMGAGGASEKQLRALADSFLAVWPRA